MADIGDTYYCAWRRETDGTLTAWEIRRPTLRANARSMSDLWRSLGQAVEQYYDDNEAALHFDPPPFSDALDPA